MSKYIRARSQSQSAISPLLNVPMYRFFMVTHISFTTFNYAQIIAHVSAVDGHHIDVHSRNSTVFIKILERPKIQVIYKRMSTSISSPRQDTEVVCTPRNLSHICQCTTRHRKPIPSQPNQHKKYPTEYSEYSNAVPTNSTSHMKIIPANQKPQNQVE